MKQINDSKLYFYFSLITLVISLIMGFIAYYSKLMIEPEVRELLSAKEKINENYQKAYLILRDPQVFARYENFDLNAQPIKNIIRDYDKKIHNREDFTEEDSVYLGLLLERRSLGSNLTRNTMVFFILLSIMGWIFLFLEKRQLKTNPVS